MVTYVLTDLEGVAGVEHWEPHVDRTLEEVERRKVWERLLLGEVNAAVRGAVAAGATEVRVYDGHATGANFSAEQLHRGARLVKNYDGAGWLPHLDLSVDALVIIGQHAKEGSPSAVLPHSWSRKRPRRCHLNGVEVGEAGAAIALAAYHGVKTVFLSGDRAATEEARDWLPEIEVVTVKTALPGGTVDHLDPQRACEEIEVGVERAVSRRYDIPAPEAAAPFRFRVSFSSAPCGGLPLTIARVAGGRVGRMILDRAGFQTLKWGVDASVVNAGTIEFSGASLPEVLSCALRKPAPTSDVSR